MRTDSTRSRGAAFPVSLIIVPDAVLGFAPPTPLLRAAALSAFAEVAGAPVAEPTPAAPDAEGAPAVPVVAVELPGTGPLVATPPLASADASEPVISTWLFR